MKKIIALFKDELFVETIFIFLTSICVTLLLWIFVNPSNQIWFFRIKLFYSLIFYIAIGLPFIRFILNDEKTFSFIGMGVNFFSKLSWILCVTFLLLFILGLVKVIHYSIHLPAVLQAIIGWPSFIVCVIQYLLYLLADSFLKDVGEEYKDRVFYEGRLAE